MGGKEQSSSSWTCQNMISSRENIFWGDFATTLNLKVKVVWMDNWTLWKEITQDCEMGTTSYSMQSFVIQLLFSWKYRNFSQLSYLTNKEQKCEMRYNGHRNVSTSRGSIILRSVTNFTLFQHPRVCRYRFNNILCSTTKYIVGTREYILIFRLNLP